MVSSKERVAAVDDDVAGFEEREEVLDEFVDGLAGLDHEHDAAGLLEQGGHFLEGVRADDLGAFGLVGEEIVHLGDGAVEGDHGEAVVVHVQNQVLAHDGQPNHGNISFWFHVVVCCAECEIQFAGTRYSSCPPIPEDFRLG